MTVYEYLIYDGSELCMDMLKDKDLFVRKVDGKEILSEMFSLTESKEIGEISVGDMIVSVFDKFYITKTKGEPMTIAESFLWEIAERLESIENLMKDTMEVYNGQNCS